MTYIVTEACIRCKYMDCVEVCPVDCFYEGENMLVIHPDECIDCGVCEPECPPRAILPDTEPEAEKWLNIIANSPKPGQTSPAKKTPGRRRPTILWKNKTSSTNSLAKNPAQETNNVRHKSEEEGKPHFRQER